MNPHAVTLVAINAGLLLWALFTVARSRKPESSRPLVTGGRAVWGVSSTRAGGGLEVAYLGSEAAYDARLALVRRGAQFEETEVLITRSLSKVVPCTLLRFRESDRTAIAQPGVRLEISWLSVSGSSHLEVIELGVLSEGIVGRPGRSPSARPRLARV